MRGRLWKFKKIVIVVVCRPKLCFHSMNRVAHRQRTIDRCRTSAQGILSKFHRYKIPLVQELNEDDFDGSLQFCQIMAERAIDGIFLFNVFFGSVKFLLGCLLNCHNCR